MNLYCAFCDAPHDVDLGPDDGTCMICGGPLIQDEKEREEVAASFAKAIVGAVEDGMLKAGFATDKVGRGEN